MTEKIKEYHKIVTDNIREFGYHMSFVFDADDKTPSFCYSTGIYRSFNIPEVFISSLPQNLSFVLINNYVKLYKGTGSIPLNTNIDNITDRFPVYLIEVPIENLKEYVLSTVRFYKNDEYKYLQIIYPDTQGLFPNETGYDYDQEIMGELNH